jgi:PAS domain-containing protein
MPSVLPSVGSLDHEWQDGNISRRFVGCELVVTDPVSKTPVPTWRPAVTSSSDQAIGSRCWRRRLWFVCAVLVVTTVGTGAAVIWQLHQTALANSQRELNNLGIILAEQTSRAIQSVDLMLSVVQTYAITPEVHSLEQFSSKLANETVRKFLSSQLQNLPQADTIALIDANGALLNWSRDEPIRAADFPAPNYLRQMSINDESGTLIFAPGDGRDVGEWPMFVARLIIGPGGTHFGLVVAQINTRYLEEFYRTINMLPGESVTVLLHDGLVVAGFPKIANRRGRRLPEGSPWYDRVAEGGGTYRSPAYLGGVPTTITVHPLRDYPLVVDVNVSEHAALENWREWTIGMVAATITVALGFTALFGMIAAQFGRQEDQNARLKRATKALRESERRLKAYAEMSVDWFWEQDADLRFIRDANIPLTSLPTDIGKTRWDFADDAMDPHRWDQHKADLVARRSFRDFRWERIQTDGKRRHMSTSGDPIFDEAGIFLGYHGTGRDITMELAVKDRAEQAETLLRDAVDSMSEGFVIYDRDDCFVMCNETYRQIYAEGADFLVPGANYEDILRDVLINGGSPDSYGREEDWIAERLRHHQQADGATEHRPRNGSWILATDRRMNNGGIAGLRVDITELKHSQAALHQSEARLDRAQGIAGIGSWELGVGREHGDRELVEGVVPHSRCFPRRHSAKRRKHGAFHTS